MDNFQLWKLATDAALVLSILVLCVRFMRSQAPAVNVRELRDLEIVLKNLLKDADVASRSLGESLTRRQQGLERLLSELEGGERRISVAIQSADDARSRLEKMPKPQPRYQDNDIEVREERPAAIISRAAAALDREQYRTQAAQDEMVTDREEFAAPARPVKKQTPVVTAPLELELETEAAPRRTGAAAYKSVAARHDIKSNVRKNIFGEVIGEEPSAAVTERPVSTRAPLHREIEIEESPRAAKSPLQRPAAAAPIIEDDLEQIYEAAEKLLTAGETIEAVASVTQLPLDEVRKLSRMVASARRARESAATAPMEVSRVTESKSSNTSMLSASDSSAAIDPTADPRLGVFATMRRQTQVL